MNKIKNGITRLGVITVEEFEKAVEIYGFDNPVVTAIWNTMEANSNNQDEFETIYHRYIAGKYNLDNNERRDEMGNKRNETLFVDVYASDTGLFTEDECNYDNIVLLEVPRWIVEEWYKVYEKEFKEETIHELGITEDKATFDKWFYEVYICDDFDGFYDFCIIKGVVPSLLGEDINKQNKVCYEDDNGCHIVFEGTYDECRRYGRIWDWKYGNHDLMIYSLYSCL